MCNIFFCDCFAVYFGGYVIYFVWDVGFFCTADFETNDIFNLTAILSLSGFD